MLHAEIDFPDEIANQVQATIQKRGGSFEQFVQQAVVHELQRQQQVGRNSDSVLRRMRFNGKQVGLK